MAKETKQTTKVPLAEHKLFELPKEQHPTEAKANIVKGAANHRTVAIRYRDQAKNLSERVVEPYEFKNGKLFAYCLSKNGIRAFDVPNILVAVETTVSYTPRFPILI